MLTKEQREQIIGYVRWRLSQGKIPAARYEFVVLADGSKVALPPGEAVGEIELGGKVVRVRTTEDGKLAYGVKIQFGGRRRRTMPTEMAEEFVKAFGNLLKIVKDE